jgi:hypothetical protein
MLTRVQGSPLDWIVFSGTGLLTPALDTKVNLEGESVSWTRHIHKEG